MMQGQIISSFFGQTQENMSLIKVMRETYITMQRHCGFRLRIATIGNANDPVAYIPPEYTHLITNAGGLIKRLR